MKHFLLNRYIKQITISSTIIRTRCSYSGVYSIVLYIEFTRLLKFLNLKKIHMVIIEKLNY